MVPMRMRVGVVIAAVGAFGVIAVLRQPSAVPPNPTTGPIPRPPGPTAMEEAGRSEEAGLQAPPRVPRKVPRARPGLSPAPESRRTEAPAGGGPADADRDVTGAPDAPEGGGPLEQPGLPSAEEPAPPASVSIGAGETQAGPGPVLAPPVLLPEASTYPQDAQTVEVDRSLLTPRIRVVAPEGRVVVRVLVRADGTAAKVEIVATSGHPDLDRAALERAAEWTFQPATRDGIPIDAWVVIAVRFIVP
ncbi:MAG TPA: TonB family protein [bacterium]|nr:TonB family protein [bacterium]